MWDWDVLTLKAEGDRLGDATFRRVCVRVRVCVGKWADGHLRGGVVGVVYARGGKQVSKGIISRTAQGKMQDSRQRATHHSIFCEGTRFFSGLGRAC